MCPRARRVPTFISCICAHMRTFSCICDNNCVFFGRCICARVDVFISKSLYTRAREYVFVYESICVSVFMEVSVFTCMLLYNICVYMYMLLFVIISRGRYKRVYLCVCLQICLCESSRAKRFSY